MRKKSKMTPFSEWLVASDIYYTKKSCDEDRNR